MKICKACTFLSILIILLYSCALPPEDEKESLEPDSSTSELPWTGETEKFTINTKEGVHLNDPQEGCRNSICHDPLFFCKKHPMGIRGTAHL